MKKQYIIPSTTSVSFHPCSICAGSPADAGINVGGGTLDGGGEVPSGTTIEPM